MAESSSFCKPNRGFTLVELLVVTVLVGILASVLLMLINPSELLKKTRDSRRLADLSSANKVLAYAVAEGKISNPSIDTGIRDSCTGTFDVNGTGWLGGWVSGSLSDSVNSLPGDPRNGDYLSGSAGPKFCYYFAMTSTGVWEFATVLESFENAKLAIGDGGASGTLSTCTKDLMPADSCRYEIGTDVNVIP